MAVNITNALFAREKCEQKAMRDKSLQQRILERHFFEIEDDHLKHLIKNTAVMKVFVSIVEITDTQNNNYTFLMWVTEDYMSDLKKIYIPPSFDELIKHIVEDLEYNLAVQLGYFKDFANKQFLFIVNETDEFRMIQKIDQIEHANYESNRFKFKIVEKSVQRNLATYYATLLLQHVLSFDDFDEDDIRMQWDLTIKPEIGFLQKEYDDILCRLSNH